MFEDACPKLHNIDSKNSNFLEHSRSFFFTFVTSFSLSKKLRDRANGEIWTAALMYRKPFLYQLRHNHSAKISSIKELILAAPLKSFFSVKMWQKFFEWKGVFIFLYKCTFKKSVAWMFCNRGPYLVTGGWKFQLEQQFPSFLSFWNFFTWLSHLSWVVSSTVEATSILAVDNSFLLRATCNCAILC